MTVSVQANFFDDIRTQVVAWFAGAGITLPDPNNLEEVLFAYFSVRRRLIAVRPRHVVWSRELQARELGADDRKALDVIALEAIGGVDLTPRLSKLILNPQFNDGLLDDWGIHHVHLSGTVAADGFVERAGALLYVMVKPDDIYFIDLLDHDAFADDRLLQIVHDNWPGLIAMFRMPGGGRISPSPQLSPEDRRKARKRLTVLWQAADGTAYLPPGGGASTAGLSPRVVSAADRLRQQAIAAEKWARENAALIRGRIAEQTGKRVEELRLKFLVRQPLSVLETQTNTLIRLE